MLIRLAGIEYDSVVDGPGVRTTVFVQGCPHNCPGCHNPETHDYWWGYDMDVDELVELLQDTGNPVTISGGEPLNQMDAVGELLEKLNRTDCWIYTGYTYEVVANALKVCEFDKYVDCLVDGRFHQDEQSMDCPYRGSTNQRLIDLHKSTFYNVVEWQPNKVVEPII